jgi:uncharacterized membrane protein YsdA (DUF1294 family)
MSASLVLNVITVLAGTVGAGYLGMALINHTARHRETESRRDTVTVVSLAILGGLASNKLASMCGNYF